MVEKNAKNALTTKLIYNPSSAAPGFMTKMFYPYRSTLNFKFNDRKL